MKDRPNILLITSDQQHWDTLGIANPAIQTPALDRLATQGTLFTRAYCPNPTCTPTRASIITGLYPSQHGAWSLGTKLTVYFNQPYGEQFDLEEDPGEIRNLWDDTDHQDLKQTLLLRMLHADMAREPLWMPRIFGA